MSASRQDVDGQKRDRQNLDPDAPFGSTEFAIIAYALFEIPMVANEVARALLQRCRTAWRAARHSWIFARFLCVSAGKLVVCRRTESLTMVIHALLFAGLLGKLPVALTAPTAKCEFRCKVRANVCLSADRANCRFVDILPDETTGLCVFQSMQVAQDWINTQHKYAKIDWTLHGAECVAADDDQI